MCRRYARSHTDLLELLMPLLTDGLVTRSGSRDPSEEAGASAAEDRPGVHHQLDSEGLASNVPNENE